MTGGSEAGYRKVLGAFYRDVMERLSLLQSVPATDQEAIHQFTVQVHALKSAAATIGAAALSNEAADLEAAGKSADIIEIGERLSLFYDHLRLLAEAIRNALGMTEKKVPAGEGVHDGTPLQNDAPHHDGAPQNDAPLQNDAPNDAPLSEPVLAAFASLRDALDQQDIQTADRIIAELEKTDLGETAKTAVETVSDQVLMAEYGMAVDVINTLLNNNQR
jgi:HPt (histidine-containing phosphotransfer) domain-containing protein